MKNFSDSDDDDDFAPDIDDITDAPEPEILDIDADDITLDFDDIDGIDSSIDDFGSDR